MRDRALKLLMPVLLITALVSIWDWSIRIGIINSALFPSSKEVIVAITRVPDIGLHILQSLKLLFLAVTIGYGLGFLLGILMGLKTKLSFFEDVLAFFMAIPGISWAPLFIITIGFGDLTIFMVGVLTAFFPVVYNIYHGAREIDPNLRRLGRLFEYSKRQKFLFISLPAVMNYALGALKLALARTWRTIIAVEMIAASRFGLGYMIFDARELLNTEYMFAGILLSGAIYMALELMVVRSIERVTVERWGMKEVA